MTDQKDFNLGLLPHTNMFNNFYNLYVAENVFWYAC